MLLASAPVLPPTGVIAESGDGVTGALRRLGILANSASEGRRTADEGDEEDDDDNAAPAL